MGRRKYSPSFKTTIENIVFLILWTFEIKLGTSIFSLIISNLPIKVNTLVKKKKTVKELSLNKLSFLRVMFCIDLFYLD